VLAKTITHGKTRAQSQQSQSQQSQSQQSQSQQSQSQQSQRQESRSLRTQPQQSESQDWTTRQSGRNRRRRSSSTSATERSRVHRAAGQSQDSAEVQGQQREARAQKRARPPVRTASHGVGGESTSARVSGRGPGAARNHLPTAASAGSAAVAAFRQAAQPKHESPLAVQAEFPSNDVASPDLFTLSPPETPVGASACGATQRVQLD
jgi:hypothetical protein